MTILAPGIQIQYPLISKHIMASLVPACSVSPSALVDHTKAQNSVKMDCPSSGSSPHMCMGGRASVIVCLSRSDDEGARILINDSSVLGCVSSIPN